MAGPSLNAVLLFEAYMGRNKRVSDLLMQNADPNCVNTRGRSPLHEAAERAHVDVAQTLLSAKGLLDPADEDGNTPAHVAAIHGSTRILGLLYDADPALFASVKNRDGRTVLEEIAYSPNMRKEEKHVLLQRTSEVYRASHPTARNCCGIGLGAAGGGAAAGATVAVAEQDRPEKKLDGQQHQQQNASGDASLCSPSNADAAGAGAMAEAGEGAGAGAGAGSPRSSSDASAAAETKSSGFWCSIM